MTTYLETERLILRKLTLNDLPSVFEWAGDPRVAKYMIYPIYKSCDDGIEWINSLYKNEDAYDFGFVLKENGKLIGSGGMYLHKAQTPEEKDIWSLGYNLRFDCWNNGYVTEAAKAMIDLVVKERGAEVIEGEFAVENPGSRRVMEKCGLTYSRDARYAKSDGSASFDAMIYRLSL